MNRYLGAAALAVLICASPAFAADNAQNPPSGGADTSTGAKEQSSAPPGSSAEDKSKPNPTSNTEHSKSEQGC